MDIVEYFKRVNEYLDNMTEEQWDELFIGIDSQSAADADNSGWSFDPSFLLNIGNGTDNPKG